MLLSYLIGSRWGAMGVAWGGLAGAVAARAFAVPYSLAKSPIKPSDVATTISRSLVTSMAGGLAAFGVAFALGGQEPVLRLTAGCISFAGTWAGAWFVTRGGRAVVFGMFALLPDL
jgi:uncharacterized membrane protein YfcA